MGSQTQDIGQSFADLVARIGQMVAAARLVADHPLASGLTPAGPAASGGFPPAPVTVHEVSKPDWTARKKRALELIASGMTQAKVAREVGVNPWTVSRWFRKATGTFRRYRPKTTIHVN